MPQRGTQSRKLLIALYPQIENPLPRRDWLQCVAVQKADLLTGPRKGSGQRENCPTFCGAVLGAPNVGLPAVNRKRCGDNKQHTQTLHAHTFPSQSHPASLLRLYSLMR
eukprot:m.389526 g.389526  ORF g.389526 m.389526 type:complete len:109 (-) comp16753_c0_seq43:51-377(-)